MTEPVMTVVRLNQAANRLEVMRGIKGAQNALLKRLLRKYPAINVRWGKHNYRMFDLGPVDK